MQNLRKIRKERGLTCVALGEKVHVGKSAISKYERGEIQPSNDVMIKISHELGCSTDYLLGLTNDPTPPLHLYKKNSAEEFGTAIKEIFVDAGMIEPDEEITPEFKEYVSKLMKHIIVMNRLINKGAPL